MNPSTCFDVASFSLNQLNESLVLAPPPTPPPHPPSVTWTQTKINWEGKTPPSQGNQEGKRGRGGGALLWELRLCRSLLCLYELIPSGFPTFHKHMVSSSPPPAKSIKAGAFFFGFFSFSFFFLKAAFELSEGSAAQLGESLEFSPSCSSTWKHLHSNLGGSVSAHKLPPDRLSAGFPDLLSWLWFRTGWVLTQAALGLY